MELREQLEVEEEDGDRQEEEVEEKGEVESRRTHREDGHGWRYESAQDLSHEVCGVIMNKDCEQCAQAQCMCATRSSKFRASTSSLVLCLVSCMLYASFQFSLL